MILEKIPYLRVLISLSVLAEGVRWFGKLDSRPGENSPCIGFPSFISAFFLMAAHFMLLLGFVVDSASSDFTEEAIDGRADLAFFVSVVFAHLLFGDWGLDESHWNAFLSLSACVAAVMDSKPYWYETLGWVRHLVTIFLILFAPALCFNNVFTKHLVASLTSPPGQRWRHFCDKFIVDVLVPLLLQVGEISGACIARLQAAIKKG